MIYLIAGFHAPTANYPATVPDSWHSGSLMFSPRGWALPFEIASLMLTAALVGAVWWTREGDE